MFKKTREETRVEREIRLAKEVSARQIVKASSKEEEDIREVDYLYLCSVLNSAKELYDVFEKQDHSGLSARMTVNVLKKLVNGEALSPLTGEDWEWTLGYPRAQNEEHYQNTRNTSVFKNVDKDTGNISYSYNYSVEIVNETEVWASYPPLEEPGTLNDEDERVASFFKQAREARVRHNSEIKFPYVPVTHKYKWNFDTLKLEKVE